MRAESSQVSSSYPWLASYTTVLCISICKRFACFTNPQDKRRDRKNSEHQAKLSKKQSRTAKHLCLLLPPVACVLLHCIWVLAVPVEAGNSCIAFALKQTDLHWLNIGMCLKKASQEIRSPQVYLKNAACFRPGPAIPALQTCWWHPWCKTESCPGQTRPKIMLEW